MSRSLARIARMEAAAESISKAIDEDDDLHQEAAAIAAGVPPRTYWDWMSGDDEHCEAFQLKVRAAVHRQARRNLAREDLGVRTTEGKLTMWAKWRMEKRYRTIYGDLAETRKVELSGPNGGPMRTEAVVMTRAEALAELKRLREVDPEAAAAIAGEDKE